MRTVTPWMRHVAVVVGYMTAYAILRSVSISHWQLQVGLNLACVLLLPRRYWISLMGAAFLAVLPVAYKCLDRIGPLPAALMLFPVVSFSMLPVWLLGNRLPGVAPGRSRGKPLTVTAMLYLLLCIGVVTLLTVSYETGLYRLQEFLSPSASDSDPQNALSVWLWRYIVGVSLGCLTVVPIALAVHEALARAHSWSALARHAAHSRLLLEGALLGVGSLVILSLMGHQAMHETWCQIVRMAMFLPVLWMAARYGWQGAAVGGTAASIGIVLAMPANYDPNTMLVQALMAIAIAALLPMGSMIGRLNARDLRLNEALRQALESTRRELYQSELRLRGGVQEMLRIHDTLQKNCDHLLQQFQYLLPSTQEHRYRRDLIVTKHDMHWLENTIHPIHWQRQGLAAALRDGPIAVTLRELDINYTVRTSTVIDSLTPNVQLVLYRLICEAVAYLLKQSPTLRFMQLRVFTTHTIAADDTPWMAIIVDGEGQDEASSKRIKTTIDGDETLGNLVLQEYRLSRLGAMGLSLTAMQDRARFYEGKVRLSEKRNRITLSLRDMPESPQASHRLAMQSSGT